jgi:hypothetical protein
MKNKSTWIFLTAVLALGAFTFWDFQNEKNEQTRKSEQATLIPFKADQIQSFSIENKAQKIELNKTVDGWKLISPYQDWADNSVVDEFLNQLTQQKSLSVIRPKDSVNWATYGLNDSPVKITLVHQNKQELTYLVGDKKSFENNSYLRKKGGADVILAAGDWSAWAQKTPFDFRDVRLWRGKIGAVDHFEIKNANGLFKFDRHENKWSLEGHPEVHLDQNKVHGLVSLMSETKASSLLAEKEIPAAEKTRVGLNKPEVTILLKADDKKWTAEVVKNKDQSVYALTSEPLFLVRLEMDFFQKLSSVSLNTLKDKKELFDFNKDLVKQIEYQSPIKKQTLVLKDSGWSLNNDPQLIVQQDRVKKLLESLNGLITPGFADDHRDFKAQNKIVLKNAESLDLFELSWGSFEKRKLDNIEKSIALAKSSLSAEYFYLDQTDIDKLQLQDLVKAKDGK